MVATCRVVRSGSFTVGSTSQPGLGRQIRVFLLKNRFVGKTRKNVPNPGSSLGFLAQTDTSVQPNASALGRAHAAVAEPAAERVRRWLIVAALLAEACERRAQRLARVDVSVVEFATVADEAADYVALGAIRGGCPVDGVARAEAVVLPLAAALDEPCEDPLGLGGKLLAELRV